MLRMASLPTFLSTSGRLAPKPFALGAVAVYAASFLSQFLLAAPVTARASIVPFLVVQIVIAWIWYSLHVRRLSDAGRPSGSAIALTILYALAIVLLLLVMLAIDAPGQPTGPEETPYASVFQIFLLFFLIAMILGDPNIGMFGYVVLGVIALTMLPILIAFAFTVWTGTRPRAAEAAPPPP
jgi:uncharacterized membrane protein YhaH (DUF805 family)